MRIGRRMALAAGALAAASAGGAQERGLVELFPSVDMVNYSDLDDDARACGVADFAPLDAAFRAALEAGGFAYDPGAPMTAYLSVIYLKHEDAETCSGHALLEFGVFEDQGGILVFEEYFTDDILFYVAPADGLSYTREIVGDLVGSLLAHDPAN